MIVIVDYGMGNLGSLANMLKKTRFPAKISSDVGEIELAEKLILPGVGSFDHGMKKLQELNLIDILNKKVVREKTPILGICLGMQMFTRTSEEGVQPGLGLGRCEHGQIQFGHRLFVQNTPHGLGHTEYQKIAFPDAGYGK